MRRMFYVIVCLGMAALAVQPVAAQCFTVTGVETVAGNGVLGKISNPAFSYHRTRASSTAIAVPDGVTISLNTNNIDGLPTRVYEFDVDGSGVTPGNIPVPLSSSDPMPLYNVKAARALAEAVNADPLSPVIAGAYPLGDDQYISYMWKTDAGYGATTAKGGTVVSNDAINAPKTFAYINKPFRSFVFVHGTNLNVGVTPTVKLIKSDDATVSRTGYVTLRTDDGSLLSCWFGIHKTTAQESLPDGVYDFEISQAGCNTVTVAKAITIVENMINDATFNTNLLGNWGSLNWQAVDDYLCPLWRNNNPYNDENPVNPGGAHLEVAKKGSFFFPLQPNNRLENPRQKPLPTGVIETNAYVSDTSGGDNECGSLRFPAASGRRQMWQVFQTNFPEDTFCTLTGLWAGGTTTPATLTYGVEIRQGDQNGTIIAQTDPAQAFEGFTWYPFSKILILPAGPQDITIVVYGDNSDAVDAGVHVDELLLRVGAKFWPDVDDDGDIDQTDFAGFQRCYTGAGAGSLFEGCERFDRDADMDVDAADFDAFEKCSTGAGIPPTPTGVLTNGCEL